MAPEQTRINGVKNWIVNLFSGVNGDTHVAPSQKNDP
jgi:hypothetical protein